MPKITSIHWNEETGVCEKHDVPLLPCPTCMAEKDPDIQAEVTESELLSLDYEILLPEEERLGIGGFFAPDEQWLVKRIVR